MQETDLRCESAPNIYNPIHSFDPRSGYCCWCAIRDDRV